MYFYCSSPYLRLVFQIVQDLLYQMLCFSVRLVLHAQSSQFIAFLQFSFSSTLSLDSCFCAKWFFKVFLVIPWLSQYVFLWKLFLFSSNAVAAVFTAAELVWAEMKFLKEQLFLFLLQRFFVSFCLVFHLYQNFCSHTTFLLCCEQN